MELYAIPEAPLFDRFRPEADLAGRSPRQATDRFIRLLLDDLELLLNTRQPWRGGTTLPPEAASSVIAYGLPDLGAVSLRSLSDRMEVCERVREAITAFEPRLTDVAVTDLTDDRPGGSRMALRIAAGLRIDAAILPLSFETRLAPVTNQLQVRVLDGSDWT